MPLDKLITSNYRPMRGASCYRGATARKHYFEADAQFKLGAQNQPVSILSLVVCSSLSLSLSLSLSVCM